MRLYQNLSASDINAIFLNPGQALFNNQNGGSGGGGSGSATQLASTPGYAQNTHFATVASLSSPSEVDYYRISTPNTSNGQGLVLTATVRAIALDGLAPRVMILDGNQHAIDAQILANGDGVFTVQAAGLKAGGSYCLSVSSDGTTAGVGNYALNATFSSNAASLTTFAGAASRQRRCTVQLHKESQLFQFLLSATGVNAPPGSAVQMTITDSSGNIVYSLGAQVGDTVSSTALFLKPGAYTLSFAALAPAGGPVPAMSYNLSGESISDPIGAVINDPTQTPVYTSPTIPGVFLYPNGTQTTNPFLITLMT